ncbi:hypothetical protein Y956_04497 [Nipponia nippon]|uniref:Uncharacterized protein n=1 Tax=Nipponia nippon TaxID=128390 RepID=A0A091VX08_NIPNI|nr:hypothetical protein Y956_04497 [Nipponia nippon]
MKSKHQLYYPYAARIKIDSHLQGVVTLPCCLVQGLCKITVCISRGTFCLLKNPISAMYIGQKPLTLVSCRMLQSQVFLCDLHKCRCSRLRF